ncbi:hypothetical protein E1211_29730 [Micromonospora sp. 15K316]|uniref:hypothetical protein n=1 Tax=Micromonospora sp. 15K316 TaxID=2530376 RepID=UPI001052FE39|nr:hypothetical protein [Micromonospora sp. 15K316]TDC26879.1 hypothetical protein E1211_29730 [Micromonospora sp. 15K316]
MTNTPGKLEIHYFDGWAALYIDGQLDGNSVGDEHIAEERAFGLLGVKQVYDSAFMRGQNQRAGVAPTLDDVAAYRQDRETRAADAAEKRKEAERLLADAAALEAQDRRG